jgi:hypothetical protein
MMIERKSPGCFRIEDIVTEDRIRRKTTSLDDL